MHAFANPTNVSKNSRLVVVVGMADGEGATPRRGASLARFAAAFIQSSRIAKRMAGPGQDDAVKQWRHRAHDATPAAPRTVSHGSRC